MNHKKAFTLIELLVVISIIALLVAILMPALGKARDQSRASVCSNRIRQMVFGMIYYADANDDAVLVVGGNNPGGAVSYYWYDELAEYMGVKGYKSDPERYREGVMEILHCPKVIKEATTYYGSFNRPWKANFSSGLGALSSSTGSYTINAWVEQPGYYGPKGDPYDNYYYGKKFSKVRSNTPIFMDGIWVDSWPLSNNAPPVSITDDDGYINFDNGMRRICIDRHNKKINVGFVDAHVERIDLAELWTLPWHRGYKVRPANDILTSYPNFASLLK